MKIKKGDQVLIMRGKDKGKKGKVLRIFLAKKQALVEGINLRKKHRRPRKEGEKGQVVESIAPIYASNLKIICPKCKMPVRVGYKVEGKAKARICKKCGSEI